MPTCVIPPRTRKIDLLAHHHKRSSKLTRLAVQPRTTHWLHLLPHTFPPSPTVTSRTISPYHPLFPASARLRCHFPNLSTITGCTGAGDVNLNLDCAHITPERYANNLYTSAETKSARPLRGPKLFLTSAKTGAGVSEVFASLQRARSCTGNGRGRCSRRFCW